MITDWNTYSDIMTMSKEELAKVDPADHFDKLAPEERSKVISAVKSAKGTGSTKDKIDHQIGRTRGAQTTSAIEQVLGSKKSKWSDEKKKQADTFYELLDGEVKFRESQKDGPLSSEEYTKVLSDLTREVTIKRTAFGADFLYPDVEQSVTDIDPEELRVLSKFLRDNNVPVTANNLVKAQRQASK